MADESIISSPNKLNSSIRRSRVNRKTKTFNTTFTKSTKKPCNAITIPSKGNKDGEEVLSGTLLIMYDSDEENAEDKIKKENIRNHKENPGFEIDSKFDPFAEQRLLILADRFAVPPRSATNFVATQGFKPSNNFLFQSPELPILKTSTSRSETVDTFEITDSELLQVFEENERNTIEESDIGKSPASPVSGQKPKSIVDLILEDFCGSPASPELQQSSEESNFHFKFANKPLRTYSRSRHENALARKNIAEQYLTANSGGRCLIDDDMLSNNSSTDLSVQEDLTQLQYGTDVEHVTNLQNSQNLCENLQNLSAYFTELSGEGDGKQVVCAGETIIQNNRKNSSSLVLSSMKQPATKTEEGSCLKSDERLEFNNLFPTSTDGHISVEEEFKGFESDEGNAFEVIEAMEPAHKPDCDIAARCADDITSLNDDDEWNDECDFLANFDMDVVLDTVYKVEKKESFEEINEVDFHPLHSRELHAEPMAGFRTASNKAVTISVEAQARASKILQELPPLKVVENSSCEYDKIIRNGKTKDFKNELNRTTKISKSPTLEEKVYASKKQANESARNADFYKASCNKTTAIPEESPSQNANILGLKHICVVNDTASTSASIRKELFLGFRTASSKAINISKEAQECAAKLLQQLPELNVEGGKLGSTKANEANLPHSTSTYGGFRTSSSKAIKICKEPQEQAALIMQDLTDFPANNFDINPRECLESMQFSEWPVVEEMQVAAEVTSKCDETDQNIISIMPGFLTASKKTILISEAAKQKAAGIFDNLPALPVELPVKSTCKNNINKSVTETLENVAFSEWPLLEAGEDFEAELEQQSIECNKRKRHDVDAAQNCEEASSPKRITNLICNSPIIQRSPLAHIQSAVTRSSLSELAVKTPPDYRAARGIISRKNLLSLNKRNKSNKSINQQTNDEYKGGSSAPQTPTKRNELTNEPQSPPDTPTLNLQEFFTLASMSTSTPHPSSRQPPPQMRTRAQRRAEMEATAMSTPTSDASLKRIEWDNESLNKSASSLNTSKLSNSSLSNITKMESNPTPKQRIARLRMYGKPPNVSPIYMSSTNNCRTSGLKRLSRSANRDGKD